MQLSYSILDSLRIVVERNSSCKEFHTLAPIKIVDFEPKFVVLLLWSFLLFLGLARDVCNIHFLRILWSKYRWMFLGLARDVCNIHFLRILWSKYRWMFFLKIVNSEKKSIHFLSLCLYLLLGKLFRALISGNLTRVSSTFNGDFLFKRPCEILSGLRHYMLGLQ